MTTNRDWLVSYKGLVGIASGVLGLGVVYFGYGIGTESPKKDAIAKVNSVEPRNSQRPVRAMNLALGNMVFFARDLGFAVKSVKGAGVDANAVAARIESQLIGIREMYRQEVVNNPALAGPLVLQFNVSPAGEVSQVRELSSRVSDGEFKNAVIGETAKWSFDQVVSESLEVTCPLLFVHEGMDITTLLQWEKTSGNYPSDANAPNNALPARQAKTAQSSVAATAAVPSTQRAAAKSESREFQLRYATSLRKYPNFSSATLTTLTIGTKVTVLGKQGDWLEIRSTANGPTGFIRKEFVTPSDVARK
jgi:hypothetical protein